jgi:carboxyl-terminal processing protease
MQHPTNVFSGGGRIRRLNRSTRITCGFVLVLAGVLALSCWLNWDDCSAQAGGPNAVGSLGPASTQTFIASSEASSDVNAVEAACRLIYKGHFDAAKQRAEQAAAALPTQVQQIDQVVGQYDQIAHKRQEAKAETFQKLTRELGKFRSLDLATLGALGEKKAELVETAGQMEVIPPNTEAQAEPNLAVAAKEPNEPNNITEVLAVVTKASEYADANQKRDLLSDPFVKNLIQVSVDRSSVLESQGKWLDAYSSYYAWLSAIDPNNKGYSSHTDELLERAGIAASFQDSPCETRKERYEGVTREMLERAVEALDVTYVHTVDYEQMAIAAVKRCDLLAQVLSVAFPEGLDSNAVASFAAPSRDRVNAWSVAMAGLLDMIKSAQGQFGKEEFLGVMDRVLALNETTIELPQRPLITHFAEASLETLDPYTVMIWPRQSEEFEKLMMNEFTGVGIEISKPKGFLTIGSLLPGTPADRAGLDAGDVIEAIDGIPTKDMSLSCAVKKIQGPRGTSVILTIRRTGQEKTLNVSISRDRIIVPTIRGWQRTESGNWLYMVDESHKIGYVRITSFSGETAGDFETVVRDLEDKGLNALIVDLRFNTGGLLDSAVKIADMFISDGPIVSTQPRAGRHPTYEYARSRGTHPPYPLVVLINSGSASASEIVAGALGDEMYKRAVLVGERTHGKGSVQQITPYPGGGAQLKYTVAYYHLPSGQPVKSRDAVEKEGKSDWGVGPDVRIELTSDETKEMLDVQRDNDVLVQTHRDEHRASFKKRSLEETLDSDPQLEVALLVAKTKLIEVGIESNN